MSSVFIGRIAHSISLTEIEILEKAAIVVSSEGLIVNICRNWEKEDFDGLKIVDFGDKFIVPGLIDCHAHAPQYAQLGLGTDLQLLDWLNKYTFPTESKFSDVDFAKKVYTDAVRRFLRNGTTTCVWFASLHLEASKVLCNVCLEQGQHAFVGKVCMDRNSPDFYKEESAEASLKATREFVDYVSKVGGDLVTPIITPRFAISCTSELMKGLGDLAEECKLPIQSHIGENRSEISFSCSLHPENSNYADIYHSRKLLTEKTIMAHAVYMEDAELEMMAKSGAGIAHCPRSNITIFSGIGSVRRMLKFEVKGFPSLQFFLLD